MPLLRRLSTFRARLARLAHEAAASYWFIPSLLSLLAAVLGLAVQAADAAGLVASWSGVLPFRFESVALVTTVASVMLSTAGVTFSVTIAAVANAMSLYGPRVLTTFLEDRGNQVTLGALVSAFVFGLVVLFQMPENPEQPQVLTAVATLAVALIATGMLIFFLNHVPKAIHASYLIKRIGRTLVAMVQDPYPSAGAGGPRPDAEPADLHAISIPASGYVIEIDETGLLDWARGCDAQVWLDVRPGDFVIAGQRILGVTNAPEGGDDQLAGAVVVDAVRVGDQDAMFFVDELVEVATRALSPAINDPYTAMNTMDWMAALLVAQVQAGDPATARYDDAGALRLVSPPIGFEQFARRYFEQVRPYATADRNAGLRLVKTVHRVAEQAPLTAAHRAVLRRQLDELDALLERRLAPEDHDTLRARVEATRRALAG